MEFLKNQVNIIENFPKRGVSFKDVSPLIKNYWKPTIRALDLYIDKKPDYFVGIDSRGFLFAGALAYRNKRGVIMIRKEGKLPPPKERQLYKTEYSDAVIEMKLNTESELKNVILVDDVYATGGTMKAAEELCMKCGFNVISKLVLVDLQYLHKPDENLKSVIKYKE